MLPSIQAADEDLREQLIAVEGGALLLRCRRVDEFGPAGPARSGRFLLDEPCPGKPAQVEAHRVAVQAHLVGELLDGQRLSAPPQRVEQRDPGDAVEGLTDVRGTAICHSTIILTNS